MNHQESAPAESVGSLAVVTVTFGRDLDMCRALVRSSEAAFTRDVTHYLFVDHRDIDLFKTLASDRVVVADVNDLLPRTLRKWRGALGWRWIDRARPVPGWIVQQVAKLAAPSVVDASIIMHADSDVFFIRPVIAHDVSEHGKTVLWHEPSAIIDSMEGHVVWDRNAKAWLGLPAAPPPVNDYIAPLVVWDAEVARGALQRIESVCGGTWERTIGTTRDVAEFLVYGNHAWTQRSVALAPRLGTACTTWWDHDAPVAGPVLDDWMATLSPAQCGVSLSAHARWSTEQRETFIREHFPFAS